MLELPEPYPNWRFYRFVLPTGHMKHIHKPIRNLQELGTQYSNLKPTHAYHSIAYFCDPPRVGPNDFRGTRAGYQNAYNLILGGDLIFDIDARSRKVDLAKQDALICRDWLREKGYEARVIFSGRGFHLRVQKHDLELRQELPKRRLQEYRDVRKPLVQELKEHQVLFDPEVTLNPKGLIRLVGSVHGITGLVVTPISDLERFDVMDVDRVSADTEPSDPRNGDDRQKKPREKAEGSRAGRRLPDPVDTPTTFLFVGSQVLGTVNRQIILLRFGSNTKITDIRRLLQPFVTEEHMAPFFLFRSMARNPYLFAINPSAVEQEHIPRLLQRFPENKAAYAKFRRNILPLPLSYIEQIGKQNPKAIVSYAHSNLLSKALGVRIEGVKCGGTLLRVGVGEVKS